MSFPFEPVQVKFPVLEVPAALRTEKHVGACPVCEFHVSAQTRRSVGDALGEHFAHAHYSVGTMEPGFASGAGFSLALGPEDGLQKP